MDCSGDGSVSRFGRERLLGSRSARSLLLAPSIGRDRFRLFARTGGATKPTAVGARRLARGPGHAERGAASGQQSRLLAGWGGSQLLARGGRGRDRGPPANVRMET